MVHKVERACFLRGESGARFCFVNTSDAKSQNFIQIQLKLLFCHISNFS